MIEEIVEYKLLLRSLIDNARSEAAGLTDNELVTLLMKMQGFSDSQIGRVLVKHDGTRMGRGNVYWLKRHAFEKVLHISGLENNNPFELKKESTMPKGVYDRSGISQRRDEMRALAAAKNGNIHAENYEPAVEETHEPEPIPAASDGELWGTPYEVAATDLTNTSKGKWDSLFKDVLLRLETIPASRAIIYPFPDDDTAARAYSALNTRFRRFGAGFAIFGNRRNPPRLFVRRGPNWIKSPHAPLPEDD